MKAEDDSLTTQQSLVIITEMINNAKGNVKENSIARSTSHLDRISAWLWFSFGIVIFTLVAFGRTINWQLNPVIMLMSTIPTIVSGIVIKFRPLIIGGIGFWFFGILCFIVPEPWHFLIGALAVTVGYLIPGFLLRYKQQD
jgi:hypothetical protein